MMGSIFAPALLLVPATSSAPAAPPPQETVRQMPGEILKTYFSSADYPAEARRLKQEGRVRVEVAAGTDGRVTSCRIIESSGFAALDVQTCRVLRARLRFRPATDETGKPVEDRARGTVRWRL